MRLFWKNLDIAQACMLRQATMHEANGRLFLRANHISSTQDFEIVLSPVYVTRLIFQHVIP